MAKKAGGAPEKPPNVGWRGQKKRRDSDLSTLEDGSEEEEKEEEYLVNPNLHLNSDVPETVQDFIRSISRSGLTDEKETSSKKMLEEKKKKGRRPCRRDSIPKEAELERKPGVEVKQDLLCEEETENFKPILKAPDNLQSPYECI